MTLITRVLPFSARRSGALCVLSAYGESQVREK